MAGLDPAIHEATIVKVVLSETPLILVNAFS